MTFNLLTTPWLEVRRASGVREQVRPADITDRFADDPILALEFPRPDWNAALTEFLVGLCFLALALEGLDEWAERFVTPPAPQDLMAAWAAFVSAFEFDGDGPRAFQDFDALAQLDSKPLAGLLMDAPGENALRNNSDLFIKRGGAASLSLPYAAAALITLQTYAPSGGAGHRTSLRGGGPLTTLVSPRRAGCKTTTLWDRVWANVPDRDDDTSAKPDGAFPWLQPTITSENGKIVTQEESHPALAFFACPRRIRLAFAADVICDLSGARGPGAIGLRTQNYGANYTHWQHPLSPYRQDKKSGLLPQHPQAGAAHYGDWLAWWGFGGKPAESLKLWDQRQRRVADLLAETPEIAAFGFDMDNMKARQWLDARLPWVPIFNPETATAVHEVLEQLISATHVAAKALTRNAKLALYGVPSGNSYKLPETLSLDALREVGERLWQDTEADFRAMLKDLLQLLRNGPEPTTPQRQAWRHLLRRHTLRIFDETVDVDGLTTAHPHRLLWARNSLSLNFADHARAEVLKELKLAPAPKPKKDAA
jgi:CRISPR system Cascade subunit CasA